MNNREWLYSLDVADLSDWFDAEHVETEERALDGDTDAQNADSREKLEADVYRAADEMDRFYCGEKFIDTRKIIGWLDRQAEITQHEITERWAEHLHPIERKCGDLRRKVEELTAERDKLQEQLLIGWECECRLQAERERYREKFGKCLDYADAIHALMDDEGMA